MFNGFNIKMDEAQIKNFCMLIIVQMKLTITKLCLKFKMKTKCFPYFSGYRALNTEKENGKVNNNWGNMEVL